MRFLIAALIVCLCFEGWGGLTARAQDEGQQISRTKAVLVVTINMPRDVPDMRAQFAEDSIEQCWEDAKEFVARGVPKQVDNALGVMAACAVPKQPEEDL